MKDVANAIMARSIYEAREVNREIIEKALKFRSHAYLANVKASLLLQTIFKIDLNRKALKKEVEIYKLLQESLRRQALIFENTNDSILIVGVDGQIVDCNKSAEAIFCRTKKEIVGKDILPLLNLHKTFSSEKEYFDLIKVKGCWEGEIDFARDCDGNGVCEAIAKPLEIKEDSSDPVLFFVFLHDITEQKRLTNELELLAMTDKLTQTYNRLRCDQIIKRELERAVRSDLPLAIIMIDIDHFKKINDDFGHLVGDQTLKAVAGIIKLNIREIDYLIRWGGEEFLLIAPDTDLQQSKAFAEKLRKAVRSVEYQHAKKVTASFGVTILKKDDTEKSLLKRADDALYLAKENGRDRVEAIA